MTILARLEQWREQGAISPEQHAYLASLSRGEPVSLFLELNVLLYAGVLAFVAGLGWTVTTWSQQMGDVLVLSLLSAILAACFWYCFSRAPEWSPAETAAPTAVFDYVLYLGTLVWGVELTYLESRFHVLSGQWDIYLLASAVLFFFLAYRFDNRFVLSLALSSLAGWFGLTISRWPSHQDATYRQCALLYCLLVTLGAVLLQRRRLKPHFFGTYLNIAANVLFWALLSGVFKRDGYTMWLFALVVACSVSLSRGLKRRQFAFVVRTLRCTATWALARYSSATSVATPLSSPISSLPQLQCWWRWLRSRAALGRRHENLLCIERRDVAPPPAPEGLGGQLRASSLSSSTSV